MPSRVIIKREVLGEKKTVVYTGLDDGEMNDMVGRVLTLLEASLPAGSQLDAIKSIAKQEMWRTFNGPTGDWVSIETSEWDKENQQYAVAGVLSYPGYPGYVNVSTGLSSSGSSTKN